MRRRMGGIALAFLFALSSACAQTTSLFELVKTGTPQTIQTAIDQGGDVNAQNKDGWTPLMIAAANNQNPEAAATLLKSGADVKARANNGWTPLMFAARYSQNVEVVATLLKAGADLEARNSDG